jgi:hypothetical protein
MKLSELEQLNAVIGLSKRIDGWPSTLADLGYQLERIELNLRFPDPSRPGITVEVTPDILFVAFDRNYSRFVELKSGRLQDLIQLNKLIQITPRDLVLYGRVGLAGAKARDHKISVSEFINDEYLSEFLDEFSRVRHKACLLCCGTEVIKSYHGEMPDQKADRVFKTGIDISTARRPTRLIRVLPTTDDKYALTSSVVEAFRECWLNSEHSVSPLRIAERSFRQLWGAFDKWAQNRYLAFAKSVLEDMQRSEFNRHMRPIPGKDAEWRLLHLPEEIEHRQQTKAFQAMQKATREYKWRAQHGSPYPKQLASQPSFMDLEEIIADEEDDVIPEE